MQSETVGLEKSNPEFAPRGEHRPACHHARQSKAPASEAGDSRPHNNTASFSRGKASCNHFQQDLS